MRHQLLLSVLLVAVAAVDDHSGQLLGGAYFTDRRRLWAGGRVRYYIETATAENGETPFSSDDARIRQGIEHWEENTCIRFQRCATRSACAEPYIYFIASKGVCNSYRSAPDMVSYRYNKIRLSKKCNRGSVIHEIGHSMGLIHEHARYDRDEYIKVFPENAHPDNRQYLAKTFEEDKGKSGRDVGVYDYASIMHYEHDAFSNNGKDTIVSPQGFHQDIGLSRGDIATIDFLYNGCRDYLTPTCIASKEEETVHFVPYGKEFSVEFNAEYRLGGSMSVSFAGTTAPRLQRDMPKGTNLGDSGFVRLRFTPRANEAGRVFTLAATFSSSEGRGAATCSVQVRVAPSKAVCFGKAASDPTVCSGRGDCIGDVVQPCNCRAGRAGPDCSGTPTCPRSYHMDLDYSFVNGLTYSSGYIDKKTRAVGVGSMYETAGGIAKLMLEEATYPQRISFYVARDGSSGSAKLSFRSSGDEWCFRVEINSAGRVVTGSKRPTVASNPPARSKEFRFVELDLDWQRRQVRPRVDGRQAPVGDINPTCVGIAYMWVYGPAWYDDLRITCPDLGPAAVPTPVAVPAPVPSSTPGRRLQLLDSAARPQVRLEVDNFNGGSSGSAVTGGSVTTVQIRGWSAVSFRMRNGQPANLGQYSRLQLRLRCSPDVVFELNVGKVEDGDGGMWNVAKRSCGSSTQVIDATLPRLPWMNRVGTVVWILFAPYNNNGNSFNTRLTLEGEAFFQ